ncbi:hypothetical protein K239x_04630 [Planctomycetes bacterium K23_9]|uniref:Uncharacterized protein n=1 Tax=Stieleria marina TaxID=1930275 RepID=A0A517NN31_9BACT|nr:hypothetical protein K239x_04630 [Planctomycetes bacterium K23_9]
MLVSSKELTSIFLYYNLVLRYPAQDSQHKLAHLKKSAANRCTEILFTGLPYPPITPT